MNRFAILGCLLFAGCSRPTDSPGTLHVAAASNLSRIFPALARACANSTGLTLVPSFGNTAQLAQQIENGGPFDLFLAADTAHVANLEIVHKLIPNSMHNYAQGRLVLYAPRRPDLRKLEDLALPSVKKIGIAKPELAPYGKASIETLTNLRLWPALEPKAVYGQNIGAVLQFVDSSNVDAAFTALALVNESPGNKILVDAALHAPLDQALGIPSGTAHPEQAARAAAWFLSPEAQRIFSSSGYGIAAQDSGRAPHTPPATVKP